MQRAFFNLFISFKDQQTQTTTSYIRTPKKTSKPRRSDALNLASILQSNQDNQAIPNNKKMECSFCKTNDEPAYIYTTHRLKNSLGHITCPILRAYTCPKCHATGDYSHTITYCPIIQKKAKAESIRKYAGY